jgi:DNA-binding CsgD family transcriptional regulator
MSKVIVIQCDISDLKEALLRLDKVPLIVAPVKTGPEQHKEEILAMSAQGLYATEIAMRLGLNKNSVKDLIYRERKKTPHILEQKLTAEQMDHSRVLVDFKAPADQITVCPSQVESCKEPAESAALPPTEPLPEITGIQKAINAAIRGMVERNCSVVMIMGELNRNFGRNYTKDDITGMIAELREDDTP